MAIVNQPADAVPLDYLTTRAKELRRSMLAMARRIGQGYIGQGLGIADLLAALYFHELRYDPAAPPGRTATASCCRPDTTRLPCGQRWRKPGYFRPRSCRRTAPTEAGSTCRRSTRRQASRSSAGRSDTGSAKPSAWLSGCGSTARARGCSASSPMASCRKARPGRRRWPPGGFGLDNLVALIDCNGIQADGRSSSIWSRLPTRCAPSAGLRRRSTATTWPPS